MQTEESQSLNETGPAEWTTGRLLSVSSSYWQSCTLHAGVNLDIFTLLADRRLTAGEVCSATGADERGMKALLNALTAMGLLLHDHDRYTDSEGAGRLLNRQSPDYLGYIILHHHHLVDGWAQLADAVVKGTPVEKRSHGDEVERENFLMGMCNLAMATAPSLASQIDLTGRRRLLDLGGGPGTHAIHFCLANPELKATIYDRPTTEPFALRTVERFGLSGRIDFTAGDFVRDPLGGRYDAAWLSQILHSHGPEECRMLIEKTAAVLEPGGLIMIHEFFLHETMDGPVFPALFSLNMLINNPEGRSYSAAEMSDMLADAGLARIRLLDFRGPNDSAVLCGEAPA